MLPNVELLTGQPPLASSIILAGSGFGGYFLFLLTSHLIFEEREWGGNVRQSAVINGRLGGLRMD